MSTLKDPPKRAPHKVRQNEHPQSSAATGTPERSAKATAFKKSPKRAPPKIRPNEHSQRSAKAREEGGG